MNLKNKLEYGKLQLEQLKAYALLDHARIVSGAYKTYVSVVWSEEHKKEMPATDERKLNDAMGILERRCHMIYEAVERQAELMEQIEKKEVRKGISSYA